METVPAAKHILANVASINSYNLLSPSDGADSGENAARKERSLRQNGQVIPLQNTLRLRRRRPHSVDDQKPRRGRPR